MSARKSAAAFTVAALLISTAPAHASPLTLEEMLKLDFGNGYQINGQFNFSTLYSGDFVGSQFLYDWGTPITATTLFSEGGFSWIGTPGATYPFNGQTVFTFTYPDQNEPPFYLNPGAIIAPGFWQFSLDGVPAVGGNLTCVAIEGEGGTSPCTFAASSLPLPDALPMFGAALLALGGFAAWRSRRAGQG
jgi:hypothetical protein